MTLKVKRWSDAEIESVERKCNKCGQTKTLNYFVRFVDDGGWYVRFVCKECKLLRQSERRRIRKTECVDFNRLPQYHEIPDTDPIPIQPFECKRRYIHRCAVHHKMQERLNTISRVIDIDKPCAVVDRVIERMGL